jgi:hypothetical protein
LIGIFVRLKIAVALIAAGLLAVVLGIALRTIWAPPETVSASYSAAESAAPVTVIEPGVLGVDDERVDITVEGEGEFFLAVGRAGDVDAWVGEAAHTSISAVADGQLQGSLIEGDGKVPNPAGSDLWVSEETAEQSTEHRWIAPAEGDWSILLAADGNKPAPTNVTVSWPNDTSSPGSIALIIIGALLAVLGLAIAIISRRGGGASSSGGPDNRPTRRPDETAVVGGRRVAAGDDSGAAAGRAESRAATRRSGAGVLAVVLAAGTALTAQVLPANAGEPAASPEAAAAEYPVVLDGQLNRIMDAVAGAVTAGDAARDAGELDARVGGAALALREANYKVRAEPVAADPVLTSMVDSGPEWPRTVVAVTRGDDNPVPQVVVLSQTTPRENYKMVHAVQMLPGTTFPQVSTEKGGAPSVPADSKDGLLHAPQEALNLLAGYLTDGKNKDAIAENTFAEQITSFQKDQVASNDNAEISFSRSVDGKSVRALKTADGGAMVYGYMRNVMSSVPSEPGATVGLSEEFAALAGEQTTTEGVDVTYGESVAIYVPPAGSKEPISVIGVAQDLVDVRLK